MKKSYGIVAVVILIGATISIYWSAAKTNLIKSVEFPACIGKGVINVSFKPETSLEDQKRLSEKIGVRQMFDTVVKVPEGQEDAVIELFLQSPLVETAERMPCF